VASVSLSEVVPSGPRESFPPVLASARVHARARPLVGFGVCHAVRPSASVVSAGDPAQEATAARNGSHDRIEKARDSRAFSVEATKARPHRDHTRSGFHDACGLDCLWSALLRKQLRQQVVSGELIRIPGGNEEPCPVLLVRPPPHHVGTFRRDGSRVFGTSCSGTSVGGPWQLPARDNGMLSVETPRKRSPQSGITGVCTACPAPASPARRTPHG
jgi:hypothetical protein